MKSLFVGLLLAVAAVPSVCNAQKDKVDDQTLPTPAASPLSCTKPDMPMASVRNEEAGVVTVKMQIGADGAVKLALVARSSRFPRLDEAARNGALTCRFVPLMRDGVAVEQWAYQQYVWSVQ